jgi:hypothetical protein
MRALAAIFFVAAVTSGIHWRLAIARDEAGWMLIFACFTLVSIGACAACIISRRERP